MPVQRLVGPRPRASGAAAARAPVRALAPEIARYVREANLQRPAVIGHSMGGTIGMMTAARHPESVGRLMVVDMVPFMGVMFGPAGATPEGLRAVADQSRANILGTPLDQGFMAQMFSTMTLQADQQPVLMRHLRESDRNTVANAFHELIVTDLRPELSRITAPVTVLYVLPTGSSEPLTPEQYDASMKQLYANARGARLIRIDDSRHFIHWDQPARFVAEVDTFMK